MATTGTTTYNPDFIDIAEEAWERATGGATELRSGYDLRTVRRSLNLLFLEWANLGLNLWTLEELTGVTTPQESRLDLEPDTVDIMEARVRYGDGYTTPLRRSSIVEYARSQNRSRQGRPTMFAMDRQVEGPSLLLWPVPDKEYEIVYWRIRRIQEVGSGVQTQDVPFRFVPAMIAGLAYMLASKLPEGAARISVLKAQYDESWALAREEDRDKAPFRLVPRVSRW